MRVSEMPLPLIERSAKQIEEKIRRRIKAIKDVKGIRHVTVRLSAKRLDVDIHVFLDNALKSEDMHNVALRIETLVRGDYPNARVSIDTEPVGAGQDGVWKAVKDAAEEAAGSRGSHSIHIQRIDGRLYVDFHLEVSANMTVKQAHDVAEQVEGKIRAVKPEISEITVHIESASGRISRELTGGETELESYIEHVAKHFPEIKSVSGISVRKAGNGIHVALRCRFEPELGIKKAHEISSKFEKALRTSYPKITRIDVHEEPA
jgi:divalent metal cation (Fe/Co/Zn/Cd) transporter